MTFNKFSDHVVVDKNSKRNIAGDVMRFNDFVKLSQLQKSDEHQDGTKYDSVKDVARLKDFLGMTKHEKEYAHPDDIGSRHVNVHDEEEMAKGNVKHSSSIADLPKDAPAIGQEHNPPDKIAYTHVIQHIKSKTLDPNTTDHFKQDSYTIPQGQDLDIDGVIDSTEGSSDPVEGPKYGHTMDKQDGQEDEHSRRRKINYRVHEEKLTERKGTATYSTERPLGAQEGDWRMHPDFVTFSDDFNKGVDAVEQQLNAAAQLKTVDPLVRQTTMFTPQADLKTFQLPKAFKSTRSSNSSAPLMNSNVDIFATFDDLLNETESLINEDLYKTDQRSERLTTSNPFVVRPLGSLDPTVHFEASGPEGTSNFFKNLHPHGVVTPRKYKTHDDFKERSTTSKTIEPSKPMIHKESLDEPKDVQDDEESLNKLADTVNDEHDILHLYGADELSLVDPETNTVQHLDEDHQLDEVLSRTERIKVGIRFARSESKRERKIQIALKRHSDSTTLNRRARQLAIRMLKERLVHKPTANLSIAEKERVEQMLSQRKKLVDRLALKLVPKIKQIERTRLTHPAVTNINRK